MWCFDTSSITLPFEPALVDMDTAMEAGGRQFSLHGRVVKGVRHHGQDESMEAGGRQFSLHGRVVKGVGHLGQLWRREVVSSIPDRGTVV